MLCQARDLSKNLPMLSQSNAAGQTLTEIFEPYFSVFVEAQDKWVYVPLFPRTYAGLN